MVEKMVENRLRWFGHVVKTYRFIRWRIVRSLEAKEDLEKLSEKPLGKIWK